jgi:hypothetical protein
MWADAADDVLGTAMLGRWGSFGLGYRLLTGLDRGVVRGIGRALNETFDQVAAAGRLEGRSHDTLSRYHTHIQLALIPLS